MTSLERHSCAWVREGRPPFKSTEIWLELLRLENFQHAPLTATESAHLSMSSSGITVDGKLIPHTAPLYVDSAGRPISAWPQGLYPVRGGTIWVASSFNTQSFDSRYFGPIPESAVLHRLRPLWISE